MRIFDPSDEEELDDELLHDERPDATPETKEQVPCATASNIQR